MVCRIMAFQKVHILYPEFVNRLPYMAKERASLVAQMVKNLPEMQETCISWVRKSSREGNGNPSSVIAWRIPLTEDPGGLQARWGCNESDKT